MPGDSDIFGAVGSAKPEDSDIFKDVSAKTSAAPVQAQPTPALTPHQAALENLKKNGWGTGVPKLMYEAGGKLTDLLSGGHLPPEMSAGLGAMVNAIPDALQMALGGNVGATANPVSQDIARWLMRSALKPSGQANPAKTAAAVETMLKEGVNPTTGGVDQLKGTLSTLGKQVNESIAKSGATIDTTAVADAVPNALERFKNGPLANQAVEDLGKVQTTFIEHPNVSGAKEIPVQVAQDMKQGYQRAVGDKGYGELKSPTTEGEKQIARALREQIAEKVPAVTAPLQREQAVINALKMAERRAAVDANKNPIGLGILNPAYLPIWLWDRSTLGKALTARSLYSGNVPALMGAGGGALYGSMQDRE
jgi:hypothetical protein